MIVFFLSSFPFEINFSCEFSAVILLSPYQTRCTVNYCTMNILQFAQLMIMTQPNCRRTWMWGTIAKHSKIECRTFELSSLTSSSWIRRILDTNKKTLDWYIVLRHVMWRRKGAYINCANRLSLLLHTCELRRGAPNKNRRRHRRSYLLPQIETSQEQHGVYIYSEKRRLEEAITKVTNKFRILGEETKTGRCSFLQWNNLWSLL